MNNFILMAEIVKDPELRYTPDGQTAITELMVQFPGLRDNDPMETIKAVGWGNLAQDIQAQYHLGDRVVLEGRLSMNTVERPEGFKEKLAEMTIQRIYPLGADTLLTTSIQTGSESSAASSTATSTAAPPPRPTPAPPAARTAPAPYTPPVAPAAPAYQPPADPEPNYDDIPF
ncbi:MAG: single-stranded DNA-binding protein [Leptolyngbya sp. DLM2.Bin15]|nr:MAG: single-stranded DNA-binding protein [Leptolyngbya sp. DLM2.Bin15]